MMSCSGIENVIDAQNSRYELCKLSASHLTLLIARILEKQLLKNGWGTTIRGLIIGLMLASNRLMHSPVESLVSINTVRAFQNVNLPGARVFVSIEHIRSLMVLRKHGD